MPDKGNFNFITGTYKYYCLDMFRGVESKDKVEEKPKGENPTLEKKEDEKGKAKAMSVPESPVTVFPPRKRLKVGESASATGDKGKGEVCPRKGSPNECNTGGSRVTYEFLPPLFSSKSERENEESANRCLG